MGFCQAKNRKLTDVGPHPDTSSWNRSIHNPFVFMELLPIPDSAYHRGALSKPKSLGRPFRLRARARFAGCIWNVWTLFSSWTIDRPGLGNKQVVYFSIGVLPLTTVSSGLWWYVILMGEIGFILHKRIYATNHSVISQMLLVMHFWVCCMFHKICMIIFIVNKNNTTNIIYTVDWIWSYLWLGWVCTKRDQSMPLWIVACVVDLLKCREASSHQKGSGTKNGGAVPFKAVLGCGDSLA